MPSDVSALSSTFYEYVCTSYSFTKLMEKSYLNVFFFPEIKFSDEAREDKEH